MNKVLAIARIAIRNAVRSRIVIILLGVLLLAIVGLPLTVKGDGTLTGQVRILLGYTLGLVSFILSLATLWAGCSAVSLEIQERQIHLIVTKPVRRAQIWLGKWLGLLILNAALIAFSGAVVYFLLRWTTRPEKMSAEQRAELRDNVLIACTVLKPEPIRVDDAARAELKTIRARKSPAAGCPRIRSSEGHPTETVDPGLFRSAGRQAAMEVRRAGRTACQPSAPVSLSFFELIDRARIRARPVDAETGIRRRDVSSHANQYAGRRRPVQVDGDRRRWRREINRRV